MLRHVEMELKLMDVMRAIRAVEEIIPIWVREHPDDDRPIREIENARGMLASPARATDHDTAYVCHVWWSSHKASNLILQGAEAARAAAAEYAIACSRADATVPKLYAIETASGCVKEVRQRHAAGERTSADHP